MATQGWEEVGSNRLMGTFLRSTHLHPPLQAAPLTLPSGAGLPCRSPVTQEHCQQEEGPEKIPTFKGLANWSQEISIVLLEETVEKELTEPLKIGGLF